jgi:copper(I)-binding protein
MLRHALLGIGLIISAPALAQTPTSAQPSNIQVQNAWARATTPHAQSGGIFLTVIDNGPADRLVGAATPVAATAQLHQTMDDKGVMKMDAVPTLDLPQGKPVALEPGGYHIMLMGLKQQLKPGDHFPVTLTFANAPPVTATVTVGKAGASGPEAMGDGMGNMKMP